MHLNGEINMDVIPSKDNIRHDSLLDTEAHG